MTENVQRSDGMLAFLGAPDDRVPVTLTGKQILVLTHVIQAYRVNVVEPAIEEGGMAGRLAKAGDKELTAMLDSMMSTWARIAEGASLN